MGLAIVRFSLIALVAAAAFAKCDVNHETQNEGIQKLAQLRHANREILAGENTPVWLARHYPQNEIVYQKLANVTTKQPTIVKESMIYWDSIKHKEGFRVRRKPILDPKECFNISGDTGNERLTSFSLIKEENITDGHDTVLHPSVLVVMDYHDVHPEADKREPWLAKEQIIYALAFWSTLGRSLRQIRNPRVSLRIAGIVISTTRHASPYLKENKGEKTLVNALPKMLRYWQKVANENSDFRIGSFDIIAHMTDIHPRAKCKKCAAPHHQKPTVFCIASKGPPCKLPNKMAGFIIHDDLAFKGLYLAISQMPKIFGSSAPPKVYHRRKWTKDILDPISTGLKGASCMSAPKGRPPGKRVAPILAGELLPGVKQCEAAGYRTGAWTCWHTKVSSQRSDCQYLACSYHHSRDDHCSEIGRTLDGTFCNEKNTMFHVHINTLMKKYS